MQLLERNFLRVYVDVLLIDKGFCKVEKSSLWYALLYKFVYISPENSPLFKNQTYYFFLFLFSWIPTVNRGANSVIFFNNKSQTDFKKFH